MGLLYQNRKPYNTKKPKFPLFLIDFSFAIKRSQTSPRQRTKDVDFNANFESGSPLASIGVLSFFEYENLNANQRRKTLDLGIKTLILLIFRLKRLDSFSNFPRLIKK